MRIGFVLNKLDIQGGGSNQSLNLLAKQLERRGHEVIVITANLTKENTVPKSVPYKVVSKGMSTTNPVSEYQETVQLFFEHEDDVNLYHVFEPFLVSVSGYYKKTGGETPVIGRLNSYSMFCTNSTLMNGECHKNCSLINKMMHDDTTTATKFKRIPLYLYNSHAAVGLSKHTDKIFSQSPAVKNIYTDVGIGPDQIKTVPNFYNPKFTSATLKPYKERDIDLLFVGRLEYGKGPDILLEAVDSTDLDMNVAIVGDGPLLEDLKSKYGDDNIQFLGWQPHNDLPEIYNDSTYFIHPGRWPDPCPRTVLEALQNRCIPIVSEMGGPPWMIGDAGYTFETGNSDELAGILNEIAMNEPQYDKKQIDIESELNRFSPQTIISTIEDEYGKLIN